MATYRLCHPLAEHHLTALREASTPSASFRQHLRQLATRLAAEASRDLPTTARPLRTPVAETTGSRLAVTVGIVPILRAGLSMVEPLLDLITDAHVWNLGLYREEETTLPVAYKSHLPVEAQDGVAFIVDPMLATGGSACAALDALRRWGVPKVKLVSIIAAEAGIGRVEREFPGTDIHVCAVDPELNDRKFIVPGLGDAGDRTFNTHPW